jgi:hypothetical protein
MFRVRISGHQTLLSGEDEVKVVEEERVPEGELDLGLVSYNPPHPDLARYDLGVVLVTFPGCWKAQHPLHRDGGNSIIFRACLTAVHSWFVFTKTFINSSATLTPTSTCSFPSSFGTWKKTTFLSPVLFCVSNIHT